MITNRSTLILLIVLLVSIIANIFLFFQKATNKFNLPKETIENLLSANNSLVVDDPNVILHFQPLKQNINNYLEQINKNEKHVAVYVQSLKSGAWLGINETEEFTPASLLKVPIAMAILKKIEEGDANFNNETEVILSDIDAINQITSPLAIGTKLNIREQLQWMLTHSNNTAKNMILRQLKSEDLSRVFVHVGVLDPYLQSGNKKISTRSYTRILKSLYFSTYLNKEHSALILSNLTDARAENLLATGVPWEIQVAHKYGEVGTLIHDCGIVYIPNNPYSVCLMTQNIPAGQAVKTIQDISAQVYEFAAREAL